MLSHGMKWFIIIAIAFFIFLILMVISGSRTSVGMSDYQDAKNMCGTKGVASFNYKYNIQDDREIPNVTCK